MATIHKLTKDGATIFPATITDAVVHQDTGKTLTSMIKEYNVSELFPTEGIAGGNTYNLALAVQVLGTHLRASEKTGGIKLTFISSVFGGPVEEYYLGKNVWSSNSADWKQRFEVGDAIIDPAGDWDPSTAEAYIDQQIGIEASTRLAQDTYLGNEINVIKKNKVYLTGTTLSQSQINQTNTIYVIKDDLTLSENITVPANCVLQFDGGSLNEHIITLNKAKIVCNSDNIIFKSNITINKEISTVLKTSWFNFDNAVSTTDLLLMLFKATSNYGTIYIDRNIILDKPLNTGPKDSESYFGMLGTKIIGISSNKLTKANPVISPNFNIAENSHMITLYCEAITIKNIEFDNEIENGIQTANSSLLYLTPSGGSDNDSIIDECSFNSPYCEDTILLEGRGPHVKNSFFRQTGNTTGSAVHLLAKGIDEAPWGIKYFESRYGMRAIIIENNRFHNEGPVGSGTSGSPDGSKYCVEFEQDPIRPDARYINAVIKNNCSDINGGGIISNAKHFGLLIDGNSFSVNSVNPFCEFTNDVEGFVFSDNIISTIDTTKGKATIVFRGNKAEDIIIANNSINALAYGNFVKFNTSTDTDQYIRNVNIINNSFGDNTFLSSDSVRSLMSVSNRSIKNVTILGNKIIGNTTYTSPLWGLLFIKTCNYNTSVEDIIITFNSGSSEINSIEIKNWGGTGSVTQSNNIEQSNLLPKVISNWQSLLSLGNEYLGQCIFITTDNMPVWYNGNTSAGRGGWSYYDGIDVKLSRSGSTSGRPTGGYIYVGFRYFDTDLGKPIYWTGDTTKGDNGWVDANGNNPSQS